MRLSQHAAARPYVGVMAKTAMPLLGGRPLLSPEGWKNLGHFAEKAVTLGAVGVPLITATAAGASALYDKMTAASRKAKAFKAMVTENPHLNSHNQVLVQRYFNTLHTLNPQFADDPTVAASFVNNAIVTNTNPATPHRDIYARALELQRGATPSASLISAGADISKALGGMSAALGTQEHQRKMQDMVEQLRGTQQEAKVQQRWRSLAKNRAKGLQEQLGEAQAGLRDRDYYESLLQQHGIQY